MYSRKNHNMYKARPHASHHAKSPLRIRMKQCELKGLCSSEFQLPFPPCYRLNGHRLIVSLTENHRLVKRNVFVQLSILRAVRNDARRRQ